MTLTARQEKFIEEYLQTGNGARKHIKRRMGSEQIRRERQHQTC